MKETKLDLKGIFSFLSMTFAVTYAIEGGLILGGLRLAQLSPQLIVAPVMWVPALATVFTIRFVTRERFTIVNFRFGSWKPYLTSGLLVPLCFIFIYGLTWSLGLGQPDWELTHFLTTHRAAFGGEVPS